MIRKIDALLAEYGESHQNPTNKLVHWICVPAIFWTIVALLWLIPMPAFMGNIPYLNWATVALVLAIIYYLTLTPRLAVGVFLYYLLCILVIRLYLSCLSLPLW